MALHLYIRAQQLLSEAEIEIHRVVYDLHPPVLDTMGGEHLGLIGRKERAEGLGATLTAISAPELPARCSGAWSS